MCIVEDRPHKSPAAAAALHELSQQVAIEQHVALAMFAGLLQTSSSTHSTHCGTLLWSHSLQTNIHHQHGINADAGIRSVL
jgi:hypothetical protein